MECSRHKGDNPLGPLCRAIADFHPRVRSSAILRFRVARWSPPSRLARMHGRERTLVPGESASGARRQSGSPDVFISFYNQDEAVAAKVHAALTKAGVECFFSSDSIRGGSQFYLAIEKALKASKVVVLVLSSRTEKSTWVAKELNQSINLGKAIIPFQIDEKVDGAIEFMVNTEQHVRGWPGPKSEHLDDLVRAVRRALGTAEMSALKPHPEPKPQTKAAKAGSEAKVRERVPVQIPDSPRRNTLLFYGVGAGVVVALGWGLLSMIPKPARTSADGCAWTADAKTIPIKVSLEDFPGREEALEYVASVDDGPECPVAAGDKHGQTSLFYAPEGHTLTVRVKYTEDGKQRTASTLFTVRGPSVYDETIGYEE